MNVTLKFENDTSLRGIRIGLVRCEGLRWPESADELSLDPPFAEIVRETRARGEGAVPAGRRAAVRNMLRHGSYKPAGRGKPSSEYLLQAALEDDFPAVNFPVDAVNIASLVSGYPISIVDTEKAGHEFLLRRGRLGERYVFNAGGQEIELSDLLCACRRNSVAEAQLEAYIPTANPVRDSMATKIFPGASEALAMIYAPAGEEGRDLDFTCERLAGYFEKIAEKARWSIEEYLM
jgi:DNA/RNA-binding domain of Phe-tRNA-synthetase-like protein